MASSGPRVIGCGHLYIRTKSGNEFPAFLVALPHGYGEENNDGTSRRYFWRTKRDFLLLNRSLQKHNSMTASTFPKKAFAKLCNQAMNGEDSSCSPWVRTDDDKAPVGGYCGLIKNLFSNERNNATLADATCVLDRKMKKSLYQMDNFLMASFMASKLNASSKNRVVEDATTLQKTSKDRKGDNSSLDTLIGIAEAYAIFCRQEDSEHLVMPSVNNEVAPTAATLGQYFASNENAKDVVSTVFKLLSNDKHINENIIFLEPSCGDGRILNELLQRSENLESKKILGVDIDPMSLEKARKKINRSDVILKCADFLSLRREHLLSIIPDIDNTSLIVLGGPPYTPKHLPEQFILRSVVELHAEVVVFILPRRCAKDAFNICKILNKDNIHGDREWRYSNSDLDNISFSFKDTTVQQPSILQSWYKTKTSV